MVLSKYLLNYYIALENLKFLYLSLFRSQLESLKCKCPCKRKQCLTRCHSSK